METVVDIYRGFEIKFNSESERFPCSIEDGKCYEKQSFSVAKKFIDEYIKNNQDFKPFIVNKISRGETITIQIVGIRKDGRFFFVNENNERKQLSEWDEREYFLVNPENEQHFAAMALYSSEIDDLYRKIKSSEGKIIKVGLKDIKSKYLK